MLSYLKNNHIGNVVLSISGGVDSACVLALLNQAQKLAPMDHPFNKDNGGKIIAVAQPINSTPSIQNRAYELAAKFGIDVLTVDQTLQQSLTFLQIEKQIGPLNSFAAAMNSSYLRTPTAYLLASHFKGIVMGTGNLDEDGFLKYFCKKEYQKYELYLLVPCRDLRKLKAL